MIQGWSEIARAVSATGDELVLRERAGIFEIRCNGWDLMSSRAHFSEQRMAAMVCERLDAVVPRVLIGGLGMGYTLRAALDRLPAAAEVVVAELLPEIIAWNRGVLGPLAGDPLDDPRVVAACADVADLLHGEGFDAIMLDVDNGPDAVMVRGNALLYSSEGLQLLRRALQGSAARARTVIARPLGRSNLPGGLLRPSGLAMTGATPAPAAPGVLAVWSADPSPDFEHRLATAGFNWTRTDIPARGGPDDPLHTIYLAYA
ncbi:MAG TPA: hypothetical protein VGG99_23545 [Acetobacteraceae bacterium]|jgi:hypothetical protein